MNPLNAPQSAVLLLSFIACWVTGGCSPAVSLPDPGQEPVSFPDAFEEAGVTWTSASEVPKADLRQLEAYFKLNPSIAEGSLVHGDPTLYTSPHRAKRFYWGRSGAEHVDWLFIQFEGRNVTLHEGSGAPFTE